MLAAALVVFREVLEAALIICVILAATKSVPKRGLYILCGGLVGAVGSVLLALFTSEISGLFQGMGQELFGAAVMFLVVGLLAWHIVWMQRHGRELVCEMKSVGASVASGQKPLIILSAAVCLAVLREGGEVVLFLQGMASSGVQQLTILGGLGFGLAAGIAAGGVMYWGFMRLPLGTLFSATNILLLLIAAGMAARGAGKLIQAGILPALQEPVWDTSAILSEKSLPGEFLSTLVGYMAAPSAMQLIFYGITVTIILALLAAEKGRPVPDKIQVK
jgi:high-affinity iron transporter